MNQQAIHNTSSADETAGATDRAADLILAASRHVALLAAWVATCGSLFFSQVLHWPPCELCWYQRILMYPLAIILGVGILRRDRGVHLYVLPLSIAGIAVALYHHLLIKTNWFPPPSCLAGIPCDVDYLNWLGFVTIPFLALVAFTIITVAMLAWALLQPAADAPEEEDADAQVARGFGTDRLAVPMIVVAVVLAFMLLSTFV
jgi:disulfide bond formation protein DsbB